MPESCPFFLAFFVELQLSLAVGSTGAGPFLGGEGHGKAG